jgi:tetratricopeptide (TPR) repeat protein
VRALLRPVTGYGADLTALRQLRIEHAARGATGPAATAEELTLRHREVLLTGGQPEELLDLGVDMDEAISRWPTWPDLRLLRATVALELHRADLARAALAALPDLAGRPPEQVLLADVAQFTGDYAAARTGYLRAARADPDWSTTARLAALAVATGDVEEADERYLAAEEEITAKQMRAFAWVRVQRGDLALAQDDAARAERCYTDADRAYPGWWYVTAHRAALDAGLGRTERAAAGYRAVLAEVDRPEFHEALGAVLAASGEADGAAACQATAAAAYTRSVARGEVHYLHHLAAFHADVRPHPSAAITWARQDVALRRSGSSLSLLAWCLYRGGRTAEALAVLDEAFALGAGDPRLRARAREIRQAVRDGSTTLR